MQVRNITIAVLAALAAVLLVGLVLKARSDRQIEIDEEALAAAKAAHKRRQARRPEAGYTPNLRRPSRPERPERPERSEPTRPERDTSAARLPTTRLRPPPSPEVEIEETPRSLAARMDAANSLYDRANYEAAQEAALVILEEQPRNVRMLRIAVSTACIMAEPAKAREYYDRLPDRDQRQMARRCARYGVEF